MKLMMVGAALACCVSITANAQVSYRQPPTATPALNRPQSENPHPVSVDEQLRHRLEQTESEVAALEATVAALKQQLQQTSAMATKGAGEMIALRSDFQHHDHIFMHPEQNSVTTAYIPYLTSIPTPFCHTAPDPVQGATANRKLICSQQGYEQLDSNGHLKSSP